MQEQINQDTNNALKSGDKDVVNALRLLKSSLLNARIALGHELTDEEAVKVIRKEMKSRIEARDMFKANDRHSQASKEEFEREVYAKYVPKELSKDEIDKIVKQQAATIDGEITFAKLMPNVMKACDGKANGKDVSECVKLFISKEK